MAPQHKESRLVWLDDLRGLAILAMIAYHFVWDIAHFGLAPWTLEYAQALRVAAMVIAGSFLTISGLALSFMAAKATGPLVKNLRYWRRMRVIAGAALLVSLGSWVFLPAAPIYFGILHHLAVAGVLLALVASLPATLLALASAGVLLADWLVSLPAMNAPAVIWLGLGTVAPTTADWVPLFPWLAAGLAGMALGKLMASRGLAAATEPKTPGVLAFLGRHSLIIYLIHQPILIGAIMGWVSLGL